MLRSTEIKRIHPDAVIPQYQTKGSAGFDFHLVEDVSIPPNSLAFLPTGLVIRAPDNYMLMTAPRSSTFKRYGLKLANSIGIVDSDYSGNEDELKLYVHNTRSETVRLNKGDRIAQGVFVRIAQISFKEVDDMGDSRGGWGSTGV